jgi:PAS domain S-box
MSRASSPHDSPCPLFRLSAELTRARTIDAAVAHTIELAEAALDHPIVSVHECDPADGTTTVVDSSADWSTLVADDPAWPPAAVVNALGGRRSNAAPAPQATPAADPRDPLRAELLVPVGRAHLLAVGTTDRDGFDDAAVTVAEGLAATLETALARIDRRRPPAVDDLVGASFDQSDEAAFVSAPDGTLVAVNRAALELTGREREELLGSDLSVLCRADATEAVREQLDRAATGASEPCRATVCRADGEERSVEFASHPVEANGSTYVHTTARVLSTPSGDGSERGGDTAETDRRSTTAEFDFEAADSSETVEPENPTDDYVEKAPLTSPELGRRAASNASDDGARRLTALSQLTADLLDVHTQAEACEAGVEAVAAGTGTDSVHMYCWNDAAGVLERIAAAADGAGSGPETVTPDDSAFWQAFATQEREWFADDTGIPTLAVPIDPFGLVVVAATGPLARPDVAEFVGSVADSVAVAIQQTKYRMRADELSEEARDRETTLSRTEEYLTRWCRAVGRIVGAESRAELREALLEFADAHWPHAWVGSYRPQTRSVVPTATTDETGPAWEISTDEGAKTERPPAIEAAADRTPVYIERTVEPSRWHERSRQLLSYGYQSAVTVPIASDGISHGILEVMSTEAAAFDDVFDHLAVLARTAAARLNQLQGTASTASDRSTITADLEIPEASPLFPSLPSDASVRVHTVAVVGSSERLFELTVAGMTASEFEAYISRTPGVFDPRPTVVESRSDTLRATVQVDLTATKRIRRLFELFSEHDARLRSARTGSRGSLVSIETAAATDLRTLIDAVDSWSHRAGSWRSERSGR